MKKKRLILFIAIISVLCILVLVGCVNYINLTGKAVYNAPAVNCYTFNYKDANDRCGISNGIINRATITRGKISYGLNLNTFDSFTAPITSLDKSFSLVFWINPRQMGNYAIFSKKVNEHWVYRNFNKGWKLLRGINNEIYIGMYGEGGVWHQTGVKIPYSINDWTHIAISFDYNNSRVNYYKNGKFFASYGLGWSNWKYSPSASPLVFGDAKFNGTIDEITYYNKVLTEQEINETYNSENFVGVNCMGKTINSVTTCENAIDSLNHLPYASAISSGISGMAVLNSKGNDKQALKNYYLDGSCVALHPFILTVDVRDLSKGSCIPWINGLLYCPGSEDGCTCESGGIPVKDALDELIEVYHDETRARLHIASTPPLTVDYEILSLINLGCFSGVDVNPGCVQKFGPEYVKCGRERSILPCCPKGYTCCGNFCCNPQYEGCVDNIKKSCNSERCKPGEKLCNKDENNNPLNVAKCCPADNECTYGSILGVTIATCSPNTNCNDGDASYCGTGKDGDSVCCNIGLDGIKGTADDVTECNFLFGGINGRVYFCQAKKPENCPSERPQFCKGTNPNTNLEIHICCQSASIEQCANHPNGAPYCAPYYSPPPIPA